jgi:hypothetical protein
MFLIIQTFKQPANFNGGTYSEYVSTEQLGSRGILFFSAVRVCVNDKRNAGIKEKFPVLFVWKE